MVRVTYVWHDCFVIELPSVTLVFDYWLDADGERRKKPSFLQRLRRDVPLLVFVSHFHKDHYNPDIFGWQQDFADVHYVVSIDVMKRMRYIVSETSVYSGPKVSRDRVCVLHPSASCKVGDVEVEAYPSTDTGNSYLVRIGNLRVFHAGDLNAWTWRGESTPEEIAESLAAYNNCLDEIEKGMRSRDDSDPLRIDFCMFPVDSRIGDQYAEGASLIVRRFNVVRFFPMHFALGEASERLIRGEDALRFDNYANPERGEYIGLGAPNDTYQCPSK